MTARGALVLAMIFAGCQAPPCADGTLFVTLTFDGAAREADQIVFHATIDGNPVSGSDSGRTPGDQDTVAIHFAAGYPQGQTIVLEVVAEKSGVNIGAGSATVMLGPNCAAVALSVGAIALDAAADGERGRDQALDGASVDSAMADAAAPDLVLPDLSAIPDLSMADLAVPDLGAPACQVDKDCPSRDGGPVPSCCNGRCTDESADQANCGGCGVICTGVWKCCQSVCVDWTGDTDNCGGCGITCPLTRGALATQCAAKMCEVGACAMGDADCDGKYANGCEVALATAAQNGGEPPIGGVVPNCGACGTTCTANGGQRVASIRCTSGNCAIASCAMGYGDCDGNYGNGCESNVGTSDGQQSGAIDHCGSCGKTCPLPSQASGTSCVGGGCKVTACNAGYADCDGNFANGCEANLLSDAKNCKTCGNACGMNQVCTNGVCVMYVGGASCAGLAMNCGPRQSDNCCASEKVPGGTFNRSNDMNYPATVSDFQMDKYLITVGRFRQFLNEGYGTQAKPPANGSGTNRMMGTGWDGANWNANLVADTNALKSAVKCDNTFQTWTDAVANNENLPQNCIDWYESFAFCVWDGGRLPSEAEYNYAAEGGSDQRPYPWSMNMNDMTIDASFAVYSVNSAAVVGSKSPKGDGKWGQSDLAGNLFEWNFDWYANSYANPCVDCSNLRPSSVRVARSSVFFDGEPSSLLASYRGNLGPMVHNEGLGARCVRTP